jgi:hypothetical protein
VTKEFTFGLLAPPRIDDAHDLIIGALQASRADQRERPDKDDIACDLKVIVGREIRQSRAREIAEAERTSHPYVVYQYQDNSWPFLLAAWELVRRGVLTPCFHIHPSDKERLDLNPWAYRLTPAGLSWLDALAADGHLTISPYQHDRFLAHLLRGADRFGEPFVRWSKEALECYRYANYLAACVMAGAAAEAMVLAMARVKKGDDAWVAREARTRGGMTKLENYIVENQNSEVRRQLQSCFALVASWRNDAAHPVDASISETEAFTSLATLARVSGFVHARWAEITG